jgi:hypothetical protein
LFVFYLYTFCFFLSLLAFVNSFLLPQQDLVNKITMKNVGKENCKLLLLLICFWFSNIRNHETNF